MWELSTTIALDRALIFFINADSWEGVNGRMGLRGGFGGGGERSESRDGLLIWFRECEVGWNGFANVKWDGMVSRM